MRALIIVAALAASARAEPERYAFGADLVSSTLFRGVGLEAGLRVAHWRGRIGFAHQNIPSAFVDMDSRDKGWSVTTDLVVLAADYWFGTARDGAYVTLESSLNRIELGAPGGGSTTPYAPTLVPGAGYHWSPLGNALYLEPRAFLIINGPAMGSETVGGMTYHHPPVIPGAWLVVGAQL